MNSESIICPYCGSNRIVRKAKVSLWECANCEERFAGSAPELTVRSLDGRAMCPKSIFFSYGHDGNRDLVRMFTRDLEKRGHHIWFDEKDIGGWDDWKGKITRGIDASQMAIAFMSKHSIRDPGVCRNELAIAMNRFGTVYPMLVESGVEQDIPVTIRHLQWPDLSQWKDIRDGKVPGMEWDRWYEEKLLNLIEKLEGDATVFADETRVLRETLQPASFESRIAQHVPGFIGREWIFDAYRHWVDDQPESRLFWIKAGPGVGKSAIAANLAHRQRSAIVASWFCDAKSIELKDPDTALKSIAFQLALRWEDYRVKLLRGLQLHGGATEAACREARKELARKNTQDLFLHILAEPMAGLIWREHKLVVVIDALDEATDEQGNNRITELVANELSSLPEWIGFVVTSRPEAGVVNRLHGFKPFELDAADDRNLADLRSWYKEQLGRRPELGELPGAMQQRIEDRLIERSCGMILYLKVVEEGFKEGSVTVAQLDGLEAGLPGLYRRYYDVFQHRFGSDYDSSVKPLLRLLLAAAGPLPDDLACAILGWNSEQFLACVNRLGSYVVETTAGRELFHKTLAEWLSDKSSGAFHLDRAVGQKQLAQFLWQCWEEFSLDKRCRWDSLVFEWLPGLMRFLDDKWNSPDELLEFMINAKAAWGTRFEILYWPILAERQGEIVRFRAERSLSAAQDLSAAGTAFRMARQYGIALQYQKDALDMVRAIGEGPETIRLFEAGLAEAQIDSGDFVSAEAILKRLARNISLGGPIKDNPLFLLARVYSLQNRFSDAEHCLQELLAIPDIDDLDRGHIYPVLSASLLAQGAGQFQNALDAAERAIRINCDRPCALCARSLVCKANVLAAHGRIAEAEAVYRKALDMFDKPHFNPDAASTLTSVAKLRLESGDLQQSLELLEKARSKLTEAGLDNQSPEYVAYESARQAAILRRRNEC